MKRRVLALIAWPIYIVVAGEAAPAEKIGSSTCRNVPLLAQRFVRDMRAKDMSDVLSLYAADAVFIQPDGSRVVGRSALENLYRTVFATYDSELSPQDFKVQPEAAGPGICVQSGQFEETLRLRSDGTQQRVNGRYRFTYRRTKQGNWLIQEMSWTMASQGGK